MTAVRAMLMRGGSSKGAYFVADELPGQDHQRDALLLRIMGSPDERQIDGVGGAHPLTSKVAVVARSNEPGIDVDYLFLQVGVDEARVSDRQNCGNLLAGVGPFALERGLVVADQDAYLHQVRIRMVNTNSVAVATFAVADGMPTYDGDTAISGVPGTASPIRLDFEDVVGATAGALLPTDHTVDQIDGIACTLIDNGMPVVVMQAEDLGVTGYESCAELEADKTLRSRLERIRLTAGPLMNLGDVSDATVPKLTMVAPPRSAGGHLCTRTFIPHRCHQAIGVLGAVSVARAALLNGSPAAQVYRGDSPTSIVLEHPTGNFETSFDGDRAGIIGTARKLMDGTVYPRPS